MHALADAVVLFAELYQLAQLAFEQPRFFAQGEHLPLRQRNGAAAMRVREVHGGEELGMLLEELRVLLQVASDVL